MDAQQTLLERIARQDSALLSPLPFAHSQELKDDLPLVRRHVGPGAWYQALEASLPSQESKR